MSCPYKCGLAALFALAPFSLAGAAIIQVGQITIDKYEVLEETLNSGPGARMVAHYDLNAAFNDQTFHKKENLRWLQRLSSTESIPAVTPIPNRPMIDLRKDQNAPGHPNGKGDDLPFYDFSYPSVDNANTNQNIKIDGSGIAMRDDPRGARGMRDFTVSFTTLVVSIQPDNLLTALGGFQWGFKVNPQGAISLLDLDPITADNAAFGRFDPISTALRNDFPAWQIVRQSSLNMPDQHVLAVVPEPGALCALGLGLACLRRRSRR